MLSPPKPQYLTPDNSERLEISENKQINLSADEQFSKSPLSPDPLRTSNPYLLHKPYRNNAPPKSFLCFSKRNTSWRDMPNREICPLLLDHSLPDNKIQTSKYTWLTFLPINLIEQFSQLANIYFLLITVMQTIPAISITNGEPVMAFPLTVILTISALKALFEDYKRHKSDNQENDRSVLLFKKQAFVQAKWSSLKVGDIIQVKKNEPLPADLILLYSSDPKGKCYVETKNLDGETNLKVKLAHKDMSKHFSDSYRISESSYCSFFYDSPNPYLYQFKGTASIFDAKYSLDYSNFLLRGCSLKTTDYIYGLVVFTGHETKIMLNSVKAKPKQSCVEKLLSKMVFCIFITQLVYCCFTALYYRIMLDHKIASLPYLFYTSGSASFAIDFFTRLGNWILIFTNFVPISMLVTLELVRFAQAYIVSTDEKMKTEDIYPVVQSSNLNEEIGQVQYIFSDKTGTLTSNQMVFKKISIGGSSYGGKDLMPQQEGDELAKRNLIYKNENVTNVNFQDGEFFKILEDSLHENHAAFCQMLLAQAACHTVVIENEGNVQSYSASSPDELALVNFAKLCNFEYEGTDERNMMTIKTPQKRHVFEVLNVFEFNSDRKRMSVLVRNEDDQFILFCKGADSVIFKRLTGSTLPKLIEETDNNLNAFGNEGLRTLAYAMKKLDPNVYNEWAKRYQVAMTTMIDREKAIETLQDELERDLELLGATGIEDMLQDKVGETISFILDAEIKLWVLTGDKVETAQSIGKSCGLIRKDMKQVLIQANNDVELDQQLTDAIQVMRESTEDFKFYLLVTGETLLHLSNSSQRENLKRKFTRLALEAKTVLACRVSPKQKQEVVEFVRKAKPNAVTLSIGDGANDVNMITAANVGVGIRGKEGLQAARASDYSIGEFKHLKRLMFVYGREFYRKNSHVLLYNFFKNMILVLPQFWYGFFNMFSGQALYDGLLYQCFNLFYASLPIVIYAVFDYQYKDIVFETYAQLYDLGRKNLIFRFSTFFKWVINGSIQAAFLGIFSFYIIQNVALNTHGIIANFWVSGALTFTAAVLIANFKVLLFSYVYNALNIFCAFGGILIYYISYLALSKYFPKSDMFNIFAISQTSVYYWAGLVIIVITSTGLDSAIGRGLYLHDYQRSKIMTELPSPGNKIEGIISENEEDAKNDLKSSRFRMKSVFQISNK